jgi:hypothetical protein
MCDKRGLNNEGLRLERRLPPFPALEAVGNKKAGPEIRYFGNPAVSERS